MASTAIYRLFCRSIVPINCQNWNHLFSTTKRLSQARAFSCVDKENKPFEFSTSVRHFDAKELSVKTIDNVIIIEGKHKERQDDKGSIQRSFVRKYRLPKEYENVAITAELSSDGELILKIPTPHTAIDFDGHQKIPIVCIVPESLVGEQTEDADLKKKINI
jgi:HSP20 family molecular chaperone IbpA